MHQIDLHVDILYIPNAFLAHQSDTGTTKGPNTDPKPWILCVSGTTEKIHNSLPRQRMQV